MPLGTPYVGNVAKNIIEDNLCLNSGEVKGKNNSEVID
jgi:hypothetical protein